MKNFRSTYRVQLHKDFPLKELKDILEYLSGLGMSTIYASPVFKAVAGSNHGYDILDPNMINPEIGTWQELESLILSAQKLGFTWLQDIVPNHMAFFTGNPWILDLLEKGPLSSYAKYFDIGQRNDSPNGSLMIPFLGKPLEEVIKDGELKLAYSDNRINLVYYDASYPVQPRTYARIIEGCSEKTSAMIQLLSQLDDIHHSEAPAMYQNQWHELLLQFGALMKDEKSSAAIEQEIRNINNNNDLLASIAQDQHYRLCNWQETDSRINFRRFFTVNSLICLNIQEKEVLDHHHKLIFELCDKGLFNGLRIDHVDGLNDPTTYLKSIRERTGEAFIVVEKILEAGEKLPAQWQVEGTTGYEFLSLVNNLLTLKSSEESFTRFYNSLVQHHHSIHQQIRDKKALILYHNMGGELENLYRLFMNSGLVTEEDYSEMRTEDIKTAIAEFLIHCPVYRYYGNSFPLKKDEKLELERIILQVKSSRPDLAKAVELLAKIMIGESRIEDEQYRQRQVDFYKRCMQFSGPLMAKGVEDTLMYTYNRFIAHNEVGDSPEYFGLSPKEFHSAMEERKESWPHSLNATSTHDTKRGEDVRARLQVISQFPQEWQANVQEWMKMNADLKTSGAPDVNDEYFIYQTLAGTWPFNFIEQETYLERLKEYFTKAVREAKRYSTWTKINEPYEKALEVFVEGLLDPSNGFVSSMEKFQEKISDHGIINSLSQVVLKHTCPGIPDTYQGCELWDFSLVDPDNRRPVNYTLRKKYLDQITGMKADEDMFIALWNERKNGMIKLWLTRQMCTLRSKYSSVFSHGEYIPVKAEGKYKDHIFSFARKFNKDVIVIAIPLHTGILERKQDGKMPALNWEDTAITLPAHCDEVWEDFFSGVKFNPGKSISAGEILSMPFAILKGSTKENERGAGILLHISSLPSAYGIGDLGPAAYSFADTLAAAGQKFWQILPLNPVEEGQGFSPYSAISSFAGNPLFISPEKLMHDGLLQPEDIYSLRQPASSTADFKKAEEIREELLGKAWNNFKDKKDSRLFEQFIQFRKKEKYWLEDFALYKYIKTRSKGLPWYEWQEDLKLRNTQVLENLKEEGEDEIEKTRFVQFVFDRQWKALRNYCNETGIKILGDLPFYVSFDSADVWAHRELFKIDEEGNITGVAGVPPDAFSADGQLWGMPVYQWDAHRAGDYDWWKKRLAKNIELFDLIRLDHFRAFEACWEVPAGEPTAKTGEWIKGPGEEFFNSIKKSLGSLPFVAEDLGEITPEVYALRDALNLPGMKVLQFAFGENFNQSEHIPHFYDQNFFAYTGTHDNNTLAGWLADEAGDDVLKSIQLYAGKEMDKSEMAEYLCRLAYSSVARTVIIPLQDVLGLGSAARMNTPSSAYGNWSWKLLPGEMEKQKLEKPGYWSWIYNRG